MSTPFTVTTEEHEYSVWMNELVKTLIEHDKAIGEWTEDKMDIWFPDGGVQYPVSKYPSFSGTRWMEVMQYWVLNKYSLFVDHVNGPLAVDEKSFLHFTDSSFRAVAGLSTEDATPGHFLRRLVDRSGLGKAEPTWAYGKMEPGDIAGPWLFEDLQKCFSALWKTHRTSVENIASTEGIAGYGEAEGDCAAARAAHDASWAASTWTTGGGMYYGVYGIATAWTQWESWRARGKAKISGLPTDVPVSAVLYFAPYYQGPT